MSERLSPDPKLTDPYPNGFRLAPDFLNPDIYPDTVTVWPRYQDLDPLGHVNNVAMAGLFEDARIRFNHPMKQYFQSDGVRTMIAGQTLNYPGECHLHPELDFHVGIGRISRSSWNIHACAYQGEKAVFAGLATLVTTREGKAAPIPQGLRDMLVTRRIKL